MSFENELKLCVEEEKNDDLKNLSLEDMLKTGLYKLSKREQFYEKLKTSQVFTLGRIDENKNVSLDLFVNENNESYVLIFTNQEELFDLMKKNGLEDYLTVPMNNFAKVFHEIDYIINILNPNALLIAKEHIQKYLL